MGLAEIQQVFRPIMMILLVLIVCSGSNVLKYGREQVCLLRNLSTEQETSFSVHIHVSSQRYHGLRIELANWGQDDCLRMLQH